MNTISAAFSGSGRLAPYFVAIGLVLASFIFRLAFEAAVGVHAPLLPFIVAVLLTTGLYGIKPGVFAICLSVLAATWSFPSATHNEFAPEKLASLALFVGIAGGVLLFVDYLRKARKKAEELELELQQVQANAAMGTMVSILAHELNQPLTAASNYLAACQRLTSIPGNEKREIVVDGLKLAEAQIQRAGSIIRHARGLASNLPVKRSMSSLRRMVGRVIDLVNVTETGADVRFEVDIRSEANVVRVNTIQIEQVLLNLVRNAHQAMQGSQQRAEIRIKATLTDRGKLIEVQDTGPGIPRNQLATLFSAAPRSSGQGLGIGLSICRTIVEAHEGSIWAQNNPEGGASFFVLLPDPGKPTN